MLHWCRSNISVGLHPALAAIYEMLRVTRWEEKNLLALCRQVFLADGAADQSIALTVGTHCAGIFAAEIAFSKVRLS